MPRRLALRATAFGYLVLILLAPLAMVFYRTFASGLHPAVLSERGLAKALEALALRTPIPIDLHVDVQPALSEQLEATAYYVVAEGLANAQKHADAGRLLVRAYDTGTALVIEIIDDGVGGADVDGSGLRGLTDRVEALGGTLALRSPTGAGTQLLAHLPIN